MNASLHDRDGRHVLRFERRLPHPMEKVWRALTEPAHLAHWFPWQVELEPAEGAKIRFSMSGGDTADEVVTEGVVTELDPPRLFAYTWDGSVLRWELRPDPHGCVLTFTHTFDDKPSAASFAAGWHTCLDSLDLLLAGRPGPAEGRWARRHEAYVEIFGLGRGEARQDGDGWRIRFERQLTRPVADTWSALTGGAPLAVGAPAPASATCAEVPTGTVTEATTPATAPHRLGYDAPAGSVCWELSEGPGGARLVLVHTVVPSAEDRVPALLDAWQVHLEAFAARLAAEPDER
jgi:uncharacterized protein YndB with AHSA1/START domain